jgi:light-regulated signal transduction histidine kinase (bacteriophytochrome)
MRSGELGDEKPSCAVGAGGVRSYSKTDRSRNQFLDWALVRSIVESHRGELAAENVDEGARFPFRLPVGAKNETGKIA